MNSRLTEVQSPLANHLDFFGTGPQLHQFRFPANGLHRLGHGVAIGALNMRPHPDIDNTRDPIDLLQTKIPS